MLEVLVSQSILNTGLSNQEYYKVHWSANSRNSARTEVFSWLQDESMNNAEATLSGSA